MFCGAFVKREVAIAYANMNACLLTKLDQSAQTDGDASSSVSGEVPKPTWRMVLPSLRHIFDALII